MNEDIFKGYGVEVTLKHPDDFLKVKETLTRIGIASKRDNKLFQTCHIFHKRGRYVLVHFKEMFMIDGKEKETNFTIEDKARRNKIVELLEDWGLLTILNPGVTDDPEPSMNMLKILSHKEKNEWTTIQKYNVGNNR